MSIRDCDICGCEISKFHYFGLEDEVWDSTGLGRKVVCMNCTESFLLRPFCITDFKKISVNFFNGIFGRDELSEYDQFQIQRALDAQLWFTQEK